MGTIIALILGAMTLVGYLAYMFMPSSDNPLGDTATQTNRAAAYSTVGIMSSTQQGFTTMQSRGVAISQVLFNGSETGLNGTPVALIVDESDVMSTRQLFHPKFGTMASPPAFPSAASAAADPRTSVFYYRSNIAFRGGAGAVPLELGTTTPEIAMFAPNIKTGVCLSINAQLHNDSEEDPTQVPNSGLALSAFTGTDSTPTVMTTAPAGLRARTTGCVETTDGAYVAFVSLAKR